MWKIFGSRLHYKEKMWVLRFHQLRTTSLWFPSFEYCRPLVVLRINWQKVFFSPSLLMSHSVTVEIWIAPCWKLDTACIPFIRRIVNDAPLSTEGNLHAVGFIFFSPRGDLCGRHLSLINMSLNWLQQTDRARPLAVKEKKGQMSRLHE